MDVYRISWAYEEGGVPYSIEMSFSRTQHSTEQSTRVMRAWKTGLEADGFTDVNLVRVMEVKVTL